MAGKVDRSYNKPPVSLCMIVRNEADKLKRCLQNLSRMVDEIIVLDTGSTDGTAEIAESLGARTFTYEWDESFSNARNYIREKARNDWLLWLDADEYYSPELVEEIREKLHSGSDCAGYYIPRKNYYFGKWLRHGGHYPDFQLKLYKKSQSSRYCHRVHEKVTLNGKAEYLTNYIEHYPFLTVEDYFQKFNSYTTLDAKKLQDNGVHVTTWNTFIWLVCKPLGRFLRRYFLKRGFLDGLPGFFDAVFDVAGYVVRYIKLWELQKKSKSTGK